MRRLLAHEGGYTNHPSDPGGPTNFGITIADYRAYVKPGATAADVRAMNVAEAKAIYRAHYWNALRCDELPPGVDYAVFDYGVNSGVARAGRVLRSVLGLRSDTSVILDIVVASAAACDAQRLIGAVCDERLRFLKRLSTWPVFGGGWGRRVSEVRAVALAMTARVPAPSRDSRNAQGKGAVPAGKSKRAATTGAVIAGGGAVAQQAHEAGLGPYAIAAIIAATLALALGCWLAWRAWRRHRQQTPV